MSAPVSFRWDGEAMIPLSPRQADKAFVVGETYRLVEHHDRSHASHAHYFAAVQSAFDNLPEAYADRFVSAEHLRKYALIQTGYRDEATFVAGSRAEAIRLAAFLRGFDDFAVVVVREAVVTRWTAKSQSMRAMGKKDFQESKDKVLGFLADMLGTSSDALQQARAA